MLVNDHFSDICDAVLERLFQLTDGRETYAYVRHIRAGRYVGRREEPGDSWWNDTATRAALKQLRDEGMVEYRKGLVDDEGMPAGSGYRLTLEGVKRVCE